MEITIKFDQRKKEAKALLEYLKSLPYLKLESSTKYYNIITEKAIKDAQNKKSTSINLIDFRKQLYS